MISPKLIAEYKDLDMTKICDANGIRDTLVAEVKRLQKRITILEAKNMAAKRKKVKKTKKLIANGAMYRDGNCSCCGEDGIARLTLIDRSDGSFCGEKMLQLCTDCEQAVVKASDYIKYGTTIQPLICKACGQELAENQGEEPK